jgi:hypothetical protein
MARVSWGSTSTRRSWPFTSSDTRRSTEPATLRRLGVQADRPPSTKLADDATAPDAMTRLMNSRRV